MRTRVIAWRTKQRRRPAKRDELVERLARDQPSCKTAPIGLQPQQSLTRPLQNYSRGAISTTTSVVRLSEPAAPAGRRPRRKARTELERPQREVQTSELLVTSMSVSENPSKRPTRELAARLGLPRSGREWRGNYPSHRCSRRNKDFTASLANGGAFSFRLARARRARRKSKRAPSERNE
jgi:hypothetical protein